MDLTVLELGLRNRQISTVKCFLKIQIESNNKVKRIDEFVGWDLNINNNEMQSSIDSKFDKSLNSDQKRPKLRADTSPEVSTIETINDSKSLTKTSDETSEPSISGTDFRSKFDYFLKNIESSRNKNKLEIIEINENKLLKPDLVKDSQDLSQILDSYSEGNELSVDENELKLRAEIEIVKSFTKIQIKEILVSLNGITSVKDLNCDQIRYLIISFSDTLRSILNDLSVHSFYSNIFDKSGFPGIAANIETSVFKKSQQIYIMGCLNKLFEDQIAQKQRIFGVIFPETLLRIIMRINNFNYNEALALLNPN